MFNESAGGGISGLFPFVPIRLPQRPLRQEFEAAEGGTEEVHFGDDCFISAKQYEELKGFMKAPSIKDWWVVNNILLPLVVNARGF